MSFSINVVGGSRNEHFLNENVDILSIKLKESIMVVRCELKIPSLRINVWKQSASLMMPNSYRHDRIFKLHPTTIKDPYILFIHVTFVWQLLIRLQQGIGML